MDILVETTYVLPTTIKNTITHTVNIARRTIRCRCFGNYLKTSTNEMIMNNGESCRRRLSGYSGGQSVQSVVKPISLIGRSIAL